MKHKHFYIWLLSFELRKWFYLSLRATRGSEAISQPSGITSSLWLLAMTEIRFRNLQLLRAVCLSLFVLVIPQNSATAAVSDWSKGITIVPRYDTDLGSDSFRQSVEQAANSHVNTIILVIPWKQSDIYSTDVSLNWNAPTDASLVSAINFIHSLGLRVRLKPHLDSYDGQWRAYINPGNRDGWFQAYNTLLNHYADIAESEGVEGIVIGTELIQMTDPAYHSLNTQNWRNLIGNVRGRYSGRLTYSANWGGSGWTDEKNHIEFWDELDTVGIFAYFPLNSGDNSVTSLRQAWQYWNSTDITPLRERTGKPIEFTEIGYRSVANARFQPFDFSMGGPVDHTEQTNLYEALFSYWNDYSFVSGVALWEWSSDPNAGGWETGFTPQHKPAETVMSSWFTGGSLPTPPQTFSAAATANPNSINTGNSTAITATITNTGSAASDVIVDIEIYYQNRSRVFQHFLEHQQFGSNEVKNYTVNWTPPNPGTYTVDIGVFNGQWTVNYTWQSQATSITARSSGGESPPPSGSGDIDIWWPTQGSSVSGVQPLKALLRDHEVAAYSMFWQVDDGRLNLMENSDIDYPHKETLIDVSSWHWHGSGPYIMNFLARDSLAILLLKSIDIFIY